MPICHPNTSFLLILSWDGIERISQVKDLFRPCFEDKQHFEILLLTDAKRPKENFEIPGRTYVISKSDFGLTGKLKSKKLLPTEYTHFDVAIMLSDFTGKQEKVIRSLNIRHVVGFGDEREFVDINLVGSHHQPLEKVLFAKQILSKISD